jgi:hypothetical protein
MSAYTLKLSRSEETVATAADGEREKREGSKGHDIAGRDGPYYYYHLAWSKMRW